MAALLKRFDDAAGAALPLQISGFAFLIGVVFLTVGLYRAQIVPAWAPAGLLIGSFLNLAGFVLSSGPAAHRELRTAARRPRLDRMDRSGRGQ